jgi:hypothetical protein
MGGFYLSKTTDGGNTWINGDYFGGAISSIQFINSQTGWCSLFGNGGAVFKTTNGGNNWVNCLGNYVVQSFYKVFFTDANTGWVVGSDGAILKTINGGVYVKNISTEIPSGYTLSQNYPNPFNPTTNIKFAIPKNELVTMKVYDILGREVITLVNEKLNSGTYTVDWNASEYPSGIYFYKLTTGSYSETKKMILLK